MIKDFGMENGTYFLHTRVYCDDNHVLFHVILLRLSVGMLFPIYKNACGFRNKKLMIRNALGEDLVTKDEISKLPLTSTTISSVVCVCL